jgi:hypothetical protein
VAALSKHSDHAVVASLFEQIESTEEYKVKSTE